MNEPRFTRLQQSLHQGFTLDPKAIFKEAWIRINGVKMALILAALGVAGCWLVLNQMASMLVDTPAPAQISSELVVNSAETQVASELVINPEQAKAPSELAVDVPAASWQLSLLGLLISMGLAPMTAALDMMGIYRSVDRPIRANQIFNYFGFLVPLAVASLLMGLLSAALMAVTQMLGLPPTLAMLPMLLLSMALMFTAPLILEKGFTPLQAIMTSIKLFSRQWLQLLAIQVFFILLFIIAVLSLGIVLIWVAPLFMVVKGIIYREVCGVEGEHKEPNIAADLQPSPSLNTSKDNFEA